jgi:lipopolysaccharide heptosyltransferase II
VGLLCPIGDTLFTTPALAALRRRFPRARITALVSRSNSGILDGNPDLDARILVNAGTQGPEVIRFARHVEAIKRSSFDLMVNLSPAASFVGLLAGVPEQVHLRMPHLWWLIGGHNAKYRDLHAVDLYLSVIRPLIGTDVPTELRQPRIYLASSHRADARRLLRECGLTPANLLVAMHVGGDGFGGRKRWSATRFAEVGRHLVDRFDAHVLLLGGPDDRALAEEVREEIPRGATNLAGQTSLMETAALIERSTLFIGNDSCPLHIAAAVGTPAVGIYGPSNVRQFQPIGGSRYRQRVVRAGLPCSPCFHFVGNDAPWVPNLCYSYACLKAIQTEDVVEAATALLTSSPSPLKLPVRADPR